MTVSSSLNRKAYTGDGVTTSFSTSPVVFYDTDELDVYVVTTATGASTTLTENTHYTVSGGAGSTGAVSLAGGSSPYGAPSASQTLVIVRTLDLVQEFDPQNNDGSDAGNIETAFDKLTMMVQQAAAAVARALRFADSDVSGADTTVPVPVADGVLKWNAAGTALESVTLAGLLTDSVAVSAFMETVLDDANAAAARTTLGAAPTASPTFTGQMQNADGTGALPSYSFSSGSNRGMFTTGANNLSLTPDGTTHTALINSSGNHQILLTASTSGAYAEIAANNSSNTASSQALLSATVAGASADDPYAKFVISGGTSWSIGPDNSAGDHLRVCRDIAIGSNIGMQIDTNLAVQFGNTSAAATGYTASGDVTLPATGKVRALNTPKAWCYFTISGGTVTLEAGSFNVTSVTDGGVGNYTVNLTNATADALYAAFVGGPGASNGTNIALPTETSGGTRTTTALQVGMTVSGGASGGAVDGTRVSVAIMGN